MLKEIDIRQVKENMVHLISDDWALVTAGKADNFNMMTVSWGGIGELWGKDMVTLYIRPQRYTYEFLENNNYFTLSFYPDDKKDALKFCGANSGRDVDKVEKTGLTPVFYEKAPYFEKAKLVLVCRKMAKSQFTPDQFLDSAIMNQYTAGDFHYIYYGAVEKVLISE